MNRHSVERILQIAREASVVINHVYHGPFHVGYKDRGDPVTAADQWANELICERLYQHFPDVHIVAEESAPAVPASYAQAERIFFVGLTRPLRDPEAFGERLLGDRAGTLAAIEKAPADFVGAGAAAVASCFRDGPVQEFQFRHQ